MSEQPNNLPETSAADAPAEQAPVAGRGQTAAVEILDESATRAETPDVGRGLTESVIVDPAGEFQRTNPADGAEAAAEVPAEETNGQTMADEPNPTVGQEPEELPYDPIAKEVVSKLQAALAEAGHPDVDGFLSSIDNAIFTPGIDEGQCIFLINRALRLLVIERRDIPEADRNAALVGVVDTKFADEWLKPLKAVTIPVMVANNIGAPGLKFKEGEEPGWLLRAREASAAAAANSAAPAEAPTQE